MRAIIAKELRENLRWLPVGILIVGIFLWQATPISVTDFSYSQSTTVGIMTACGMAAALFAILLGVLQSAFDLQDRQRGYLFHRMVSHNQIMYGKVLAGAIVYALACGFPLCSLTLWFAYTGPEYLPVRPAMVIPSVLVCMACFFLQPATLICVSRPGRWFGTKLLPLLSVTGPLFLFPVSLQAVGTPSSWFVIGSYLLLFATVLASLQRRHSSQKVLLVLGSVILVAVCLGLATLFSQSISNRQSPGISQAIGLDASGQPWYYQSKHVRDTNSYAYKNIPLTGEPIRAGKRPNLHAPLPTTFEPQAFSYLVGSQDWPYRFRFASIEPTPQPVRNKLYFYDNQGQILVYDDDWQKQPPLSGRVSKDGFHSLEENAGPRFSLNAMAFGYQLSQSLTNAHYNSFWADKDGIYQFAPATGKVSTLLELPIEAGTSISNGRGHPVLLLVSNGEFHQFELLDQSGNANWFEPLSSEQSNIISRALPELTLNKVASFPVPPFPLQEISGIALTATGNVVALHFKGSSYAKLESTTDATWQVTRYVSPEMQSMGLVATLLAAVIPAGLFVIVATTSMMGDFFGGRGTIAGMEGMFPGEDVMWMMVAAALMATITLAAFTHWLCRLRGLTGGIKLAWTVSTLFLGLATPLAIVAIYPQLVYEPCPGCQRSRPIDRMQCSHCAASWSSTPCEGIEMIEGQLLANQGVCNPI
jgi:hypothetical protein